MLQSSGKVTRKKVRPGSKLSNKKPGPHQINGNIHTTAVTPQANSNTGVSPADKLGDSPATLPAEVEQIFEVHTTSKTIYMCYYYLHFYMCRIQYIAIIKYYI